MHCFSKDILNNKIFIIVCIVVVFGFGLSLSYANNFGLSSNEIVGSIVYVDEDVYENLEFDSNSFELVPILDKTVNDNNKNVIRLNFLVGGSKDNNIGNIVYNISLNDLELDCELLSPYMKWRLVKNEEVISEGSLDYQFDTIQNGRLILTTTQQDLKDYSEDKSTYDEYKFYMWLSDSCQEESLIDCKGAADQSNLTSKRIKGKVSIELSVGTKKELVRNPSETLDTTVCVNGMEDED